MSLSILYEVDVSDCFESGEGSIDWKYCSSHANFAHKEACEFILHLGALEDDYFDLTLKYMGEFGCSNKFKDIYKQARKMGATRLLIYC